MKKALLLLNMGGANSLDDVEIFLTNMFNDPYILGIKNKFLRKFVAFMITKGRLKTAKHNYEQIGGKSPLCELTAKLCEKISSLQSEFDAVDFAMNYTSPFVKDVLKKYEDFDEIVLLPLYPHHSQTTVTSSLADFKKAKEELKLKAKISLCEPFYDDDAYNKIIVSHIREVVKDTDISDVSLIFSVHSLPRKIIEKGDIYEKHINEHVQILSKILKEQGLNFKDVSLAYQSRLGPVKWLEPSLNEALAKCENKKALIYPLSFCIDNSETIFELVIEYAKLAKELNFSFYKVAQCPNFSDEFASFILEKSKNTREFSL
ncbi:Ferrochelatase, protoheme ferro-lyase [Campylobacter concisus UNSW1]|uniref:ferrochelatase n=1 Tax=Campylobacter concisus TaxID=199 RepID=UPI000398B7DD|nr:ferrochelatase [Campylobacter concisus]ERJ23395.1 Ferrochelatase, protoheme ferro-lyase [Campylobacter concisus UNSW1]